MERLSTSEQEWLNSQHEPEERLFVGRRPPRKPKTWQLRGEPRPEEDERKIEEEEDQYLKKHGIV